ncbi:hypothetical protein ACFVWN_27335 [Nocardiopsis flavescens]|uniref:hypothetical protein n=1 Tax=Nocardiopsis flavescens TaxID=758803 RepID=UPI00365A22C2
MSERRHHVTDDGRYIVVDGRRWRATDPSVPEDLRDELVRELMRARRLIKGGDTSARVRVHDAKTALGERGEPWWEATGDGVRARVAAGVDALLRARDGGPVLLGEAARIVGEAGWRSRLETVRDVARSRRRSGDWALPDGDGPDAEASLEELCILPGPEFDAGAGRE